MIFSLILTLAKAVINSLRLSLGNDSGILISTSHPLGMNLRCEEVKSTQEFCYNPEQICTNNQARKYCIQIGYKFNLLYDRKLWRELNLANQSPERIGDF